MSHTDSSTPSIRHNEALPKEAHLYWIHCNRCYEIYCRKQRPFYLLTCKHVVCHNCSSPRPASDAPSGLKQHACPICGKMGRGLDMGNHLTPQVKELFHPRPTLEELPTQRILQFQRFHRDLFQKGMQRTTRKYIKLQNSLEQARANTRQKYGELEKIKRERKRKEQRIREIIAERKILERQRAACKSPMPMVAPSTTDDDSIIRNRNVPRSANVCRPAATRATRPQSVPLAGGATYGRDRRGGYAPVSVPHGGPIAGQGWPRLPTSDSNMSVELPSFAKKKNSSFLL